MRVIMERKINGQLKAKEITNCKEIEFLPMIALLKITLNDDKLSTFYLGVENGESFMIFDN